MLMHQFKVSVCLVNFISRTLTGRQAGGVRWQEKFNLPLARWIFHKIQTLGKLCVQCTVVLWSHTTLNPPKHLSFSLSTKWIAPHTPKRIISQPKRKAWRKRIWLGWFSFSLRLCLCVLLVCVGEHSSLLYYVIGVIKRCKFYLIS